MDARYTVREEAANGATHALWCLFVLAGSVCHFIAIGLYILVPGA